MAASGHIQIGNQLTLSGDYFLRQDDRPRTSSDQRSYVDPTTGLPASTQSRVSEESRPIFQMGKLGAELKATPDDTIEEVLDFTYRTFNRHSLEHDTIENNLGVTTTDYQRYRYDPDGSDSIRRNSKRHDILSGPRSTPWHCITSFTSSIQPPSQQHLSSKVVPGAPRKTISAHGDRKRKSHACGTTLQHRSWGVA